MKKKIKKQILNYTVFLEPAEEGGYIVYVPALPGCTTQGETVEEALDMAKDAIQGYLEVLKELGEEIPKEKENIIISKVELEVK
jgi:predicted RNase H-like HicB family nuclease